MSGWFLITNPITEPERPGADARGEAITPHWECGMPLAFIRTSRLCARGFTPDDVETFVVYRQDPDVARYQSWVDFTLEQGRHLIASNKELQLAVPGEWYQIVLQERTGE